jgi:hypothetical protein
MFEFVTLLVRERLKTRVRVQEDSSRGVDIAPLFVGEEHQGSGP